MHPVAAPQWERDPYGAFAKLREAGPAHRIDTPDGGSAWLVTRRRDVAVALTDPRLSLDRSYSDGRWSGFRLPAALDANLLNMDPPDHTRIRRLAAPAFSRARITVLAPRLQEQVDRLVRDQPRGEPVDLVGAVAAPFALWTICELLGVPADGRGDFRSWTSALLAPDPQDRDAAPRALAEMHRYLVALVEQKRAHPGADPLSEAVRARDAGGRLSEDELVSLAFLLLFAGYENSANLIGTAALALAQQPGLADRLRTEPRLLADTVEELVRYDGPAVVSIRRFAREDLQIGGVRIGVGETVLLAIGSANRDPAAYVDPDRFDPDRTEPVRHLGFGSGIHYCIGAHLARVEVACALTALTADATTVSLAVPEEHLIWRRSFRTRGLHSLPVRLS